MTDSSAREPLHDGGPLAITLCSTSVPMMLQLPLLSVFAGLTVFRSRAIEEGRERFRMHIGYFYDLDRAAKVLVAARRFYPGAFLAEAPRSGMGSLDDTLNAAFRFATGPAARLLVAEQLPPDGQLDAVAAMHSGGAATGVEPAYDDERGTHADADTPADAKPEATRTVAAADESIARMNPAGAHVPRQQDRGSLGVQRYAVQLKWSLSAIEPTGVLHHALFRQFTLYAVTVQRGEASEHGLRLGFFSNLHSAKQVADYVRDDFPHASVVPVSERELVRAQQAAWNELLARVGVGVRRTTSDRESDGAPRPLRRDGGLRRLWGRQG